MEGDSQKKYLTALIGSPVAHSLSPYIHNNAYALLGMEGSKYIPVECIEDDLKDLISVLKEKGFTGFNVTMPLKKAIIKYCDEVGDEARLIQGVNTVKIENGRLKGFNTDCRGFFLGLEKENFKAEKKTLTVLGSGGAARAIITGAAINDMKRVNVFARPGVRYDETLELTERLGWSDTKINMFRLSDEESLFESIRMSDILVNATSVGMTRSSENPEDTLTLIRDTSCFNSHLFVSDLIYRPKKTEFLKNAEEKGCKIMNGIPMLFWQAAFSFEIWHKKKMPEVILDRLREI